MAHKDLLPGKLGFGTAPLGNMFRDDTQRLCSDFAAGSASLGALELGVAELLRQRAGCHAVALWTRTGRGAGEELRCVGRLHEGAIDPASGRPAPVSSACLDDYLRWMRSASLLTPDALDVGEVVIAQAWQLHCSAAVAFLHVPTFYNGELCGVVSFSDHARPIAWTRAVRRDIQELISKVMLYVSPQIPRERTHETAR